MEQPLIEKLENKFIELFQTQPEFIVKAPGRVNIIGEHTDYNHGYVMPMALTHSIYIAGQKRRDHILNFYALNQNRQCIADVTMPTRNPVEPWMDYVMGVVYELSQMGYTLHGMNAVVYGNVPIGCGLSSSAALEMAILKLFEVAEGFVLTDPEAAKLGQRVENNFLGLKSGIMDQFISRCGRENSALFLDCRTLEYKYVPIAFDRHLFVIANTNCPRGLTSSKYNERVSECQSAVLGLNQFHKKNGTHLRDFTMEELVSAKTHIEEVPFKRALHVISENQRVLDCQIALEKGDFEKVGKLLNESDYSLQKNYEVTNFELETITEIARSLPGCLGARMTGAGFGGCTINLVEKGYEQEFIDALLHQYKEKTGKEGSCIISKPSEGATVVKK